MTVTTIRSSMSARSHLAIEGSCGAGRSSKHHPLAESSDDLWASLLLQTKRGGGTFTVVNLTPVQRHQLVKTGIPSKVVLKKLQGYRSIPSALLLSSIGVSSKTLGRKEDSRLNERHSDAALALMEITELAESVLGSRGLAEEWLAKPALALDGQRPLDMLTTAPGIAAVKDLLNRIEYGVYA